MPVWQRDMYRCGTWRLLLRRSSYADAWRRPHAGRDRGQRPPCAGPSSTPTVSASAPPKNTMIASGQQDRPAEHDRRSPGSRGPSRPPSPVVAHRTQLDLRALRQRDHEVELAAARHRSRRCAPIDAGALHDVARARRRAARRSPPPPRPASRRRRASWRSWIICLIASGTSPGGHLGQRLVEHRRAASAAPRGGPRARSPQSRRSATRSGAGGR